MELPHNPNIQYEISRIQSLMTKAVKNLGYKQFGQALKSLVVDNEFMTKNYDIFINYILEIVIEEWKEFEITKEDFFNSNRRGEIIVARKMAIILIKEHCPTVSDNKLSTYFGNRCRQVVYGARKEFERMSEDSRFDVPFLDRHKKLNEKVVVFIKDFAKK